MTRAQWDLIILLAEKSATQVQHYKAIEALRKYVQTPRIWPNGDGTWRPCEK